MNFGLTQEMLWGISEAALQTMRARMLQTDLAAALKAYGGMSQDVTPEKPYEMDGETAVIPVTGPLMKGYSFWCYLFGGTSMERLQRVLAAAATDPDVKSARLVFDTPGGTVAGVDDSARAIRQLASVKPVEAYISDMCCSCGYWLASQCGKIVANSASAMIGNIGTLLVVDDLSQMFESNGIVRKVYKSAPLKGAGTPGTAISKAQDAEFQSIVDGCNAEFVAAVAAGRGITMEKALTWATAHIYLGKEALAAGLIDGIAADGGEIITVDTDGDDAGGGDEDASSDGDGDQDDLVARSAAASPAPSTAPALAASPALAPATGAADLAVKMNAWKEARSLALPTTDAPTRAGITAGAPTDSRGGASAIRQPGAVAAGMERKSMKQILVKILNGLGLHRMAVGVVSAEEDSPEALARAMSEQVAAEVKDRIDNHPLMLACQAAGITTPDHLGRVLEMKALGERALEEVRQDAKAEAIRAFGPETGQRVGATVTAMGYHDSRILRDGWKAQADAMFGFDANGQAPARATAPARLNEAVVAEGNAQPAKSAWEQLNPAQQKIAGDMGFTAEADREAFAKDFLANKAAV